VARGWTGTRDFAWRVGGTRLALRFTDFCLIGGQLFGTIFGLFGLLSLLAGLDAYRQGDKYV